jgi:hypothetical protein
MTANWHRVDEVDVPADGRVRSVVVDGRSIAMARCGARLGVDQRSDVAERWAIRRTEKARRVNDDRGRGVSAAAVFDALSNHLPADAVLTVDVGNHAYSLGRYLESKGQPVLMSGYLGSIGFGYPAALGAWAARPGPADRLGHRRRRVRTVRRRADNRGQVRYPGQACPARQPRPRQDQQRTTRRRLPRLAHIAAQPRLGVVRGTVWRYRDSRDTPRGAR